MGIEYKGQAVVYRVGQPDRVINKRFGFGDLFRWAGVGDPPVRHFILYPGISPRDSDHVKIVYRGEFSPMESLVDSDINQNPDCRKAGIRHT